MKDHAAARTGRDVLRITVTLIAAVAVVLAAWRLHQAADGVRVETVRVGTIPATVYRPSSDAKAPVVVIAHGFAGSQRLMESFALSFARNGYVAVTFDFAGHGRNPAPLTGDIADVRGATRRLVDEVRDVADYARPLGDGRLAVLGHSMATDIVVRYAEQAPDVSATIAVSMFSPAVTAKDPRNLLVIVGDWEGMLKTEALRAVGLAVPDGSAKPGVTYGSFADGTARRATFTPHTEHASVLFAQASMREALGWLDAAFGTQRTVPPLIDARGPWIALLLFALLVIAWPLSAMLPRCAAIPAGASLRWRQLWPVLVVPMILTPLLLRVLPTHFLPVLVGDYLAVHFAAYGLVSVLCAWFFCGRSALPRLGDLLAPRVLVASFAVIAFAFVALVWPLDRFVTSFLPVPARLPLLLVMLLGTLCYFLSDDWLMRGAGAGRGALAVSRLCFLVSLGIAVALDLERLFFLIIVVPVIVLFFLYYGLVSRWVYRSTGHPFPGAVASAIVFAWAIGVTFPMVAG